MKKIAKARKYNSPKLQALFDEITPIEMEKTKVKMQLAARIENMMNKRGWSKSQFAEKLDKNPSEITKWFSGTNNFTIEVLTEIAFLFGVELSHLFARKETPVVYRTEIIVTSVAAQPLPFNTAFNPIEDILNNPFTYHSRGNPVFLTPLLMQNYDPNC